MIYFWSDTHFNHKGILKYCPRPYASVDEMNEGLIQLWNRKVRPSDTIYLLGDFAFAEKRDDMSAEAIFKRLNGHKHLVVGNHDERNSKVLKLPWESISYLRKIKDSGMRTIACHYALETWEGAHRGYLMVHGHSHGTLKRVVPHRFDVGVDVEKDGPVAYDELYERTKAQTFLASDHHGDL